MKHIKEKIINNEKQEHAIVIGGSIAGCLAAEVLSSQFDQVTILEKGSFDDDIEYRKNVPQEKHVHVLLHKGEKIIENIFPGLMADLKKAGAISVDIGRDIDWFHYGLWKKHYRVGFNTYFFSRSLLDNCVRSRIRKNPKITIQPESNVINFLFDNQEGQLTIKGVKVSTSNKESELYGKLVVDASGFGSRTVDLLSAAGLGEVITDQINTNLGYVSRLYNRKPEQKENYRATVVWPTPPKQQVIGLMMPIEGDRWIVSLGGWFNHFPKPEPEAFVEFARNLPVTTIYDRIKDHKPVSDIFRYRLPGSYWKHYEQLDKFPEGLLVIGASLCAINPFYGQGITLCAIQADYIKSYISGWQKGMYNTKHIQSLFAKTIQISWDMAKTEDLRFPETVGKRTVFTRLQQWYGVKFSRISALTPLARRTQLEIIHLLKPAYWALHPKIIFQIILNLFK